MKITVKLFISKVAVTCYLVITSVANQYDEHFKKFHFFCHVSSCSALVLTPSPHPRKNPVLLYRTIAFINIQTFS